MNIPKFEELKFDEEKHIYTVNGIIYPSVTTLEHPLSASLYKGIDEAVLTKAAARGTAVHNAIENYILFGIEDIPAEYKGYFDAFKKWMNEYNAEPVATESRVYHRFLNYAGTVDMPAIINGKKVLIDFKTSAQINQRLTGVQLEAYAKAYESHGLIFDEKAILHLKNNGNYSYVTYPKNDLESWNTFGALITIHNHIQKFK